MLRKVSHYHPHQNHIPSDHCAQTANDKSQLSYYAKYAYSQNILYVRYVPVSNRSFENVKFLNKNFKNILACRRPYIIKAIFESCKIKKRIVEEDEKEKNIRKVLNFGHTFGHAYEASLGFSKKLNHGEAIILGMSSALQFCKLNKILSSKDYDIILNHIKINKLPNNIKKFFSLRDTNKILSFMMNDKKNITNKINLILLKRIGTPVINKSFNKNKIESFFKGELFN